MYMDNVKIGSFIKEMLNEKHMSNRDLIRELERKHISMSEANMSKFLNGKHGTDVENYVAIADILDITVDELLNAELKQDSFNNQKDNVIDYFKPPLRCRIAMIIYILIVVVYYILDRRYDLMHVGWFIFLSGPPFAYVFGCIDSDEWD